MTGLPESTRQPGSILPLAGQDASADVAAALASAGRLDANGTMWRLRSLIAMGHDCARIGRALRVSSDVVRRIVRGQCSTVTPAFHVVACQLWDAWWDKTPPRRTTAERRAATRALAQARAGSWPAAAGLDEDELDQPGYRPWSRYRPAFGTGVAPDFSPAQPASAPQCASRANASTSNQTATTMNGRPVVRRSGEAAGRPQTRRPVRRENTATAAAPTTTGATPLPDARRDQDVITRT